MKDGTSSREWKTSKTISSSPRARHNFFYGSDEHIGGRTVEAGPGLVPLHFKAYIRIKKLLWRAFNICWTTHFSIERCSGICNACPEACTSAFMAPFQRRKVFLPEKYLLQKAENHLARQIDVGFPQSRARNNFMVVKASAVY